MTLDNRKITSLLMTKLIVASLVLHLSPKAMAQFEDFPPPPPAMDDASVPALPDPMPMEPQPDFSNPTYGAPTPAPDFNPPVTPSPTNSNGPATSIPTASGSKIIAPSKGKKSSVLSDKQRDKFARANPEDITSKNFPETIESFDFPNVEITDVIKAISELTGKNFIIDNSVRGKITIVAPSKITVAEAYKAFLSSLAINGFTVVPSGGFLKIRNARSAQRDGVDIYTGSYYPNTDQMITKVVHLKHINAEALKTSGIGRILPSSYGEVEVSPQTNSLIISDFGSSVDRMMKIVTQLDVPGFEEQLEVVGIKYAKAKDIADLIDKVVNKGQNTSGSSRGGFNSGTPRFSSGSTASASSKGTGNMSFMVFPEDRTNSLIIVGNRAGILRVKKLVSQLDFKVNPESQGGVYVYYVKHGTAETIAQTLTEVAKDSQPKQQTQNTGFGFAPQGQAAIKEGLFGGDVSIKADKNTNALVISASRTDYEKVLNILRKLDIPRDQVFVEAIIMEMNMNDGMASGGGLVKFDKNGGKAGYASSDKDILGVLNPLGGYGSAILGFSSGSVQVPDPTKPGTSVTLPNLLGYLKFIKNFGKTNILSTPQIMAMDAQEAEIEVGDRVVTSSTTTLVGASGTPQVTPNFDDATIKLTVKPFISPASETIRMEFKQVIKQISNIAIPEGFTDKVQPLATRNMKTNLVLKNGDTAVIGGLMKDDEIETTNKVPLLGDLPILGWLFKSKTVNKTKVNMLVFLTPKIIRNPSDQSSLVNNKVTERLDYIKRTGGVDPYGRTIDKILKREARVPQSVPNQKRR